MLSSVSNLANKNFVIGFFLPSLLGVIAAMQIFPCPQGAGQICAATQRAPNSFPELTFFAVSVWIIAVLLMTLNHFEYRLAEGYLPPLSWLSPSRKWHAWCLARLNKRYDALKKEGKGHEASVLKWNILQRYPCGEGQLLPMRFGNTIRAFEMYPLEVYGADAIALWPRLASVVPPAFQDLINDAHAQVDFFLNIWFLAWILAVLALGRIIAERLQWVKPVQADYAILIISIAVCLAVAYFAYTCALGRAIAWGEQVKSVFDCYLKALANQMGYSLPPEESRRCEFWSEMSRVMNYRKKIADGDWPLSRE